MVFNGHTEQYVDTLDEELFTEIQVMYADGMLGNKAIFEALAPLTSIVFNYFGGKTKASEIFPWINEYSVDPATEPTASDSLITFVSAAKNFSIDRFKNAKPAV